MGSDSDLTIMKDAVEILEIFGVNTEVKILSAHRTVDRMINYAYNAKKRGVHVIIAGAGGSAHLPGMVAAVTSLPVIGVPIRTARLCGLDSLLSIVQMPPGVPVATVAINGAKNAGILACQILGLKYPKIATQIKKYKEELKKNVTARSQKLEVYGYDKYLRNKDHKKILN
jgi:5-(carboxyamino)imidazole ribonucleotide mutase